MKQKSLWLALIIFSILVTIPYLVANYYGGEKFIFNGFLLNPQDGNSYLAKMEEGWRSDWKFTLPFSAEKSEGAYLFLFYIFLGHIARLTGLSLGVVFHLARVVCFILLIFSLDHFTKWLFKGHPEEAQHAFLLCLFGSGIGWLFLLAGLVTSDFWVVEAYPFLSGFVSPHFSLGLGILLWMFIDLGESPSWKRLSRLAISGLVMAIVMPFGVVVAGSIGLLWSISEWVMLKKVEIRPIIAGFILGGPFLLYQYLAIQQDPLLSIWNRQNFTQSPPVWDLVIAMFPAIAFSILGIFRIIKLSAWNQSTRLLLIWMVMGAVLIYFPFSLQRRFMFGYYIPVGCLAVAGLHFLQSDLKNNWKKLFPTVFFLSVITNGIVILLAFLGVMQKSALYYLTRDEVSAFEFLKTSSTTEDIILCAPETGGFIPGWTGIRVIYGHEYETANAQNNKAQVTEVYSDRVSTSEAINYLQRHQIKFVFWGPRERLLGAAEFLKMLRPVYQNGSVEIYSW